MMGRRRISETGLRLLRAFEGVHLEPAALPALNDGEPQRWLIGVGRVVEGARPAPVDARRANALLREDVGPIEDAVERLILAPLTQNQFDALACLAFNIGLESFRDSDVVARLNEGLPLEAALAFDAWRCTQMQGRTVLVDALVRRRAAEKALFLTPETPIVSASSAQIRPVEARFAAAALSLPSGVEAVRAGEDAADAALAPVDGDTRVFAPSAEEPSGDALLEPPVITARRRAQARRTVPDLAQAERRKRTARWCVLVAGVGAVLFLGALYEVLASAPEDAGGWPLLAALGLVGAAAGAYWAWRPDSLLTLGVEAERATASG